MKQTPITVTRADFEHLSVDQRIEREMPNGRQMRLRVKAVIDQPEVRLWHSDEDKLAPSRTRSADFPSINE